MYVASRELRNGTGGLLKRVQGGEHVVITVRGEPVAELVPFRHRRRRWISREELISRLPRMQADPGLRDDLRRLAGDETDDLDSYL
jgi:prevent-host-death family protein